MNFKEKNLFETRLQESTKIRNKFPERIPTIVERSSQCKNIPEIDKQKFLVPRDLTIGQFIYIIRKRLILPPEKALFIFINNTLPVSGSLMSELYAYHADKDGFLYVTYTGENTFGLSSIIIQSSDSIKDKSPVS